MTDGSSLRIASWNMQAAMGCQRYLDYAFRAHENVWSFQKRRRLEEASKELQKFDVVGLQECDAGSLRSGFLHQGVFLAGAGQFDHTAFHSSRKVGKLASSGLAVLSRFPLLETRAYTLPSRLPGRGALEVVIEHPEAVFRMLVVHLSLSRAGRARQLDWIGEWQAKGDLPAVILGDFNAQPECQHLQAFSRGVEGLCPNLKSFPSWNPTKGLDHIFTAGLTARAPLAHRIPGSDHLAVVREITFPGRDGSTRHEHGHEPGAN